MNYLTSGRWWCWAKTKLTPLLQNTSFKKRYQMWITKPQAFSAQSASRKTECRDSLSSEIFKLVFANDIVTRLTGSLSYEESDISSSNNFGSIFIGTFIT